MPNTDARTVLRSNLGLAWRELTTVGYLKTQANNKYFFLYKEPVTAGFDVPIC